MSQKKLFIFNSLLLLILTLHSCDENKFDIDISDNTVNVEWLRLDHDFTGLATKPSFANYNDSLKHVYGSFYSLYATRIMNFEDVNSPYYEQSVMRFLMHKDIHQLYMTVDSSYKDLSVYQTEISTAFSYYHHYFPEKEIPVIASMVTGLSNNIVVTDSVLGVGLDLYLGDSNSLYHLAGIPEYIRKKASSDYLVYDMMRGWVLSEFEPKNKKDDLLTQMISYGRSMYVMDALFPFAEDHYKIGFTKDEIKWCKDHEVTIWSRFIEEKSLYSTDPNIIRALTGPGPFTAGFNKESPAQVGFWVGWQIVKKYMDENPETSIEELMNLDDAQTILRKSKYKPR